MLCILDYHYIITIMERRLVSKDYSFHIVGGYIGRRRQDASFTNVTKQYQNMDVDFIGSGGNNQG